MRKKRMTAWLLMLLACLQGAMSVQADEQPVREMPFAADEWQTMEEGLLPAGSIVLLKDSTKKVMILGFLQQIAEAEEPVYYDYCGCLFPEGYISPDEIYLFDHDQIDQIYFVGYQDEEQQDFSQRILAYLEETGDTERY